MSSRNATATAIAASSTMSSTRTSDNLKRQLFWRNIVKQHNFTDENERKLIITYLTNGINWMEMKMLPKAFVQRHRGIYHFICTPIYPTRSSMIERDVTRTFSIFQKSCIEEKDLPLQQQALFRVLNAIAEAEDGYCQGMNFIAAIFLVEGLEEADAYVLFLYLLQKRHLARLFQHRSTFLDDYLMHFEQMFEQELPDLYQHMTSQGFTPPMYGIEWFTTLFSLSTKIDLSCAIFDLFFIGISDIFLRMGLGILKLLEAKLMCMQFEDFLQDFKPLVKEIDPYQAILQALAFRPNFQAPLVSLSQQHIQYEELSSTSTTTKEEQQHTQEDTTVYLSRLHFQLSNTTNTHEGRMPPRTFDLHRTLPPDLSQAVMKGNLTSVKDHWHRMIRLLPVPIETKEEDDDSIPMILLANEILHFAIWYGQVPIAQFAIEKAGANVNNMDDTHLTPLHFSVLRNQPDMVRLLLSYGANRSICGGTWSGSIQGLTPLETAKYWTFRDTNAVRLVLEHEVCVYCNTKFEKLAFGKAPCCEICQLHFCRNPRPCLARHQCPKRYYRHKVEATRTATRLPGQEQEEEEEDGDETTSTRSSLSTTESFVMINYPSAINNVNANNQTDENSPTKNHGSSSNSSLLDQLSAALFGKWKLQADEDHLKQIAYEKEQANMITNHSPIEFPKAAEWYCNHVDCHQVFAFFSHGIECKKCRGLFCSGHMKSSSKSCVQCEDAYRTTEAS